MLKQETDETDMHRSTGKTGDCGSIAEIRGHLLYFRRRLRRGALPPWLAEHRYILSVMCDSALEGLRGVTHVPFSPDDKRIPYAFTVSDAIPAEADGAAFIRALQEIDPDEPFLRTFPALRAASVFEVLLPELSSPEPPLQLDRMMLLLHRLHTTDWQYVWEAVSQVERLLSQDPTGAYPRCTEETKQAYRHAVRRMAQREHRTERETALCVLHAAQEAADRYAAEGTEPGRDAGIAGQLFSEERMRGTGFHTAVALSALAGAVCVFAVFSRWGRWQAAVCALFLFLPFYALFRECGDILAARLGHAEPVLSLELSAVPPEGKTLTVITTLLGGAEKDRTVFDNLEMFYLRNREDHLFFGVLGDLPEGDSAETETDAAVCRYAEERIRALNGKYGERFGLWIRPRRYAAGAGKFMGWERKRGAVLELVRMLDGGTCAFSHTVIPEALSGIRYVCTLDSDTELPPDAVKLMLGAMLHPYNAPRIRDGRVTEGIGMLQPAMAVTLAGAAATRFTRIMAGKGGADPYARYSADGEQILYGAGSFCGKGIFSVSAYHAVLDGAFPEESVLSHDFLEGQRLGCRNLHADGTAFSDRIPTGVISYFERQSRWVRGDTQALRFALSHVRDAEGRRKKNPVPLPGRLRIWDHVLYALIPFAAVRCAVFGSFLPIPVSAAVFLWIAAFSAYLLRPLLLLGNGNAWRALFRRFSGPALPDLARSLSELCIRILFAAYEAYVNGRAFLTALWRMLISRRKLLSWVTAGEAEQKTRGKTVSGCFLCMRWTVFTGLLLLFSRPVFSRVIGFLWMLSPFAAYVLGMPGRRERRTRYPRMSPETCRREAGEIWRFFAAEVTEKTRFLPPDNVQWFPYPEKKTAYRTSPTNIGLYLLACLAARDFGLITTGELTGRLRDTLGSMAELETFRGHFYNWYDTERGERIGAPYLSSVDSGNLACALIAAAGGAEDYMPEDAALGALAQRMREMAYSMDFRLFYNRRRGLLALGYDTERGEASEGCYDLYASEARSAVYFAAAAGQIPASAWRALGKPLTVRGRRLGALSWSGSAFEYFMPALWLAVPDGSFSAEMLSFAAFMQGKDRSVIRSGGTEYRVFGRSEGGYFGFDADMNFLYQPCGTPLLGMKPELAEERLCMPYAVFLMLQTENGNIPADETFSALEALGMRGAYGFFEALDMTPGRVGGGWAAVRSVMAHHLGMSIVSLANTAFDGIFRRRFAEDARMRAAELLLDERIPTDAAPSPLSRGIPLSDDRGEALQRVRYDPPRTGDGFRPAEQNGEMPFFGVLSNTVSAVYASTSGCLRLQNGELAVTVPENDLCALPPLFFFGVGETIYTPCLLNAEPGTRADFSVSFGDGEIVFRARYPDGITALLSVSPAPERMTFRFRAALEKDGAPLPFTLTFLFRPVLAEARAWAAHRTFSDLFEELQSTAGGITIRRRKRSPGEREHILTVTADGLRELRIQTDAGRLLPVGYGREDILALPHRAGKLCKDPAPASAAVPAVCLSGSCGGETAFFLSLGGAADQGNAGRGDALSALRAGHRMLCGGIGAADETVSSMLRGILGHRTRLFPASAAAGLSPGGRERLWKYGISGDLPLLVCRVPEDADFQPMLMKVLNAWKFLMIGGTASDLVLVISEGDAYEQPARRMAERCIRACGLSFFLGNGRRGSICMIAQGGAEEDGILFRAAWVRGEDGTGAALLPEAVMSTRHGDAPVSFRADAERIVIRKGIRPGPWTHILTNGTFGTLVTQDTAGFTFFADAGECRITPWYAEPLSLRCGEEVLLKTGEDGAWHSLCRTADTVVFEPEQAVYRGTAELAGTAGTVGYVLSLSVPDRRRRKHYHLTLENRGNTEAAVTVRCQVEPLLGTLPEDGEAVLWERVPGGVRFSSLTNGNCANHAASLTMDAGEAAGGMARNSFGAEVLYTETALRIRPGTEVSVCAALAVSRRGERVCGASLPARRTPRGPELHTGVPSIDMLVRTWLPVQVFHARLWGRCGFWQPGGAYGFRDQLQDAMAAGLLDPDTLKRQLYRCAAHQYIEGDVQHWWHPIPGKDPAKLHRGIRTRCSDDYLWLPLACAAYVSMTGDPSVLDAEIRYLESPPLGEHEAERYEEPLRSEEKESLYMHCVRAIEHAFRFGVHGLPLMGSCDWNDGMNRVGVEPDGTENGGESVFDGMLLLLTLGRFLPLCVLRGDEDGARAYRAVMKRLASAIEDEAWNGKWYRRAWYGDGTVMGDPGDAEAEIDLLPQAFAAMINASVRLPGGGKPFDEGRVHSAVCAAYERLFRADTGLFALLAPAFSGNGELPDPGYIAGYPVGVRENGGQYTHAAVWGAMGLFAVGEEDDGMRVLLSLDPFARTRDAERLFRYRREPYALCGDVLLAPDREGEGGWSQYTGSAGWYLQALLAVFAEPRFRIFPPDGTHKGEDAEEILPSDEMPEGRDQ